jgi:hypothetical protein
MGKEVTKEIKNKNLKEREDKIIECVDDSLNPTKKTTQWLVNTCVRINFNLVWSAITIQ